MKIRSLYVILLAPIVSFGQPKKGYHSHTYIYKEKKSNLYNKYQGVYEGDYKDKLRSGKGKFSFQNGDIYEGEWFMDDINDSGKMIYLNGDVYSGKFRNGLKNGNGQMNYKNGNTFVGEWSDNKRNGQGAIFYNNGDKYEGEMKDDQINGNGIMNYKSGDVYKGLWSDNKRNGQGTIFYNNGDKYEGEMKDDQINGNGIMNYKSGDVYKGLWSDNKINGHGKLISNNQIYEGDFKNGLPNGKGKITYPSKYILTGNFKDGNHIRTNETIILLDSGKLIGNAYIEGGKNIFGSGIYYPEYPEIAGYKMLYVENIEPAKYPERGFAFYNGEVNYTYLNNDWEKYFLKNDKREGPCIYEGEGFKITSQYVNDKLDGEYYAKYDKDDGGFNTIKYNYTIGILNGPFDYFGLVGKFTNNIIQREIKWFKEEDENPSITIYVAANKKPYITEVNKGSEIWKGKLVYGQVMNTLKGTESLSEIFSSLSKFNETQTGTISCGKKKKVYKNGELIEDINPLPISEEDLSSPYRCRCCNNVIYGLANSVDQSGNQLSEAFVRLHYAFYPNYVEAYKMLGINNLTFKQYLQLEHFKFCSMRCSRTCYED